eukprot:Nitzschia sp. Nitz4//scaffold193_size40683//30240//31007//NITZ4_007503-RA/size40683-processed-gene-0.13-mRNA-1//1//CDS//3329540291//4342//frame0
MAPSEPATEKRKAAALKEVVFVVCPGASSKEPKELNNALQQLGSTIVLPKWKGIMPNHVKANIDLVLETCQEAAEKYPEKSIILAGHSFGTRIIVILLTNIDNGTVDELPKSLVTDVAILESYPLYGPTPPKPTTDRAATLEKAPHNLRCLFFSGEKDEFLDRCKAWRGSKANLGEAALREVVDKMACSQSAKVVIVPNGKHNALKASKSNQYDVTSSFLDAVRSMLNDSYRLQCTSKDTPITHFFVPVSKKPRR